MYTTYFSYMPMGIYLCIGWQFYITTVSSIVCLQIQRMIAAPEPEQRAIMELLTRNQHPPQGTPAKPHPKAPYAGTNTQPQRFEPALYPRSGSKTVHAACRLWATHSHATPFAKQEIGRPQH